MKLCPAQIVRDYRYIFSLLLYYFPADNWCLLSGGAGRGAMEILIYISGILGCGLWWYSAEADWDLYSAALPDYKLFSRINTFESILSRSAAEIMGNWHTGNLVTCQTLSGKQILLSPREILPQRDSRLSKQIQIYPSMLQDKAQRHGMHFTTQILNLQSGC